MPISIFKYDNFKIVVRIVLGAVFVYASFDKIGHPAEFAKIIHFYRILPDGWENLIAIFFPWIELITGLFLIINKWIKGSLLVYNFMLIIFIFALLQAQIRGLDIACGCFSVDPSSKSEVWLRIVLDIVMLFFSLNLYFAETNLEKDELLTSSLS